MLWRFAMSIRCGEFTAAIVDRMDVRCRYCGASLFFGRHIARLTFLPGHDRMPRSPRWRPRPAADILCSDASLAACMALLAVSFGGMHLPDAELSASEVQERAPITVQAQAHPRQEAAVDDPWPALALPEKRPGQVAAIAGDGEPEPASGSGTNADGREDGPTEPAVAVAAAVDPAADRDVTGSVRELAGTWASDPAACSKSTALAAGLLPMTISSDVARAGDAVCAFRNIRQTGQQWSAVVRCSEGKKRWTSRVKLSLAGSRLSWVSQRGTQDYVRCQRVQVAARTDSTRR
jgi:hypothetical protein